MERLISLYLVQVCAQKALIRQTSNQAQTFPVIQTTYLPACLLEKLTL